MMNYFQIFIIMIIILLGLKGIKADFSRDFQLFIQRNFGNETEKNLTRADLGNGGSFGGKLKANEKVVKTPIIFIHGIVSWAGTLEPLRDFYLSKGYTKSELYATTYGPLGHPIYNNGVKCEYIKMVRQLISAVLAYTNHSTINVIGYSMGVMVTRKALLGGNCVDTGEYLGPSLTHYIANYIGIAGPNHGALICGTNATSSYGACGKINGMICGSDFINNINSKIHYEAEKVYVIQTVPDLIVGNKVCDSKATSEIAGSNENITVSNNTHAKVVFLSADIQYKLLNSKEDPVKGVFWLRKFGNLLNFFNFLRNLY